MAGKSKLYEGKVAYLVTTELKQKEPKFVIRIAYTAQPEYDCSWVPFALQGAMTIRFIALMSLVYKIINLSKLIER